MRRKFFILIAFLFVLLVPVITLAQSAPVDATFAWEQPDYDECNYWILYWGAQSGGPYTVGQVRIDKEILQPEQSKQVTISYPENAKTTYYFVMVAFKDETIYSNNSNEVPLEVDFRNPPGTPVNLRVTIIPQ